MRKPPESPGGSQCNPHYQGDKVIIARSGHRWDAELEPPPFPGDDLTPLQTVTNFLATDGWVTPQTLQWLVDEGESPASIGHWARRSGIPNRALVDAARYSGIDGWREVIVAFLAAGRTRCPGSQSSASCCSGS